MADMKKAHHKQQKICTTRPSYREGRWERAVKVYTVNQESQYVLVFNVPALGVIKDLLELFALYGVIEEYRLLDDYPCEPFTDVYYIKYKEIDAARQAKKKLDNWSFFGHQLHVCYGPEYESVQDTREKLNQRKSIIQEKTKDDHEKNTNLTQSKQTSSMSTSTKIREVTTSTTSLPLPPHIPSSETSRSFLPSSYPPSFYPHPSYPPCSHISSSQTSLLPPPAPPYPPSSHIPPSTTIYLPPPPPPYPPPSHIPLTTNTHLPPLPPPPPPYPPPSQIPQFSHVPSNLPSSSESPSLHFPSSFQPTSFPYPSTIDTTLSSFKSSTRAETKRHSTNSNVDASEGTHGFSHEERVRLFLEQNNMQENYGSGIERLKTSDSSHVISTKITITNEKTDPIINKRPLRTNSENSDIKIAKTEAPDTTKQTGLLHESLPLTGHKSVDSTITTVRNKMATVFTSFTPASVNFKPKQKKRKRI